MTAKKLGSKEEGRKIYDNNDESDDDNNDDEGDEDDEDYDFDYHGDSCDKNEDDDDDYGPFLCCVANASVIKKHAEMFA